jgi:predicted nucleic acid-binding Zn ribbon protein
MLKMSDAHPTDCPDCGAKGSVDQLLSAPAVQFKGSGWYVTDYAKKGSSSSSTKSDTKTDVKAESGSSEKKTDTKSSSTDSSSDKKK